MSWRDRFFRFHRERIELSYLHARETGVEHPLVVACDLRDRIGRWVALAALSEDEIKRRVADTDDERLSPCVFFYVSHHQALECIGQATPHIKGFLEADTPEGMFRFAIVGDGGITLGAGVIPACNSLVNQDALA